MFLFRFLIGWIFNDEVAWRATVQGIKYSDGKKISKTCRIKKIQVSQKRNLWNIPRSVQSVACLTMGLALEALKIISSNQELEN